MKQHNKSYSLKWQIFNIGLIIYSLHTISFSFHFILFSHFHENNIVKIQVMYIVRAI